MKKRVKLTALLAALIIGFSSVPALTIVSGDTGIVAEAAVTKPAKPAFQSASSTSTSITLKWKKVSGAAGYQVYRATSKSGTYKKVKTTSSLTYTNSSLSSNKTYYYKIRAYKKSGGKTIYGAYSSIKSVSTKLATPALTVSSTTANTAVLKWKKIAGAAGYELYRSTSKSGSYSKVKTTTGLSFSNSGLTSNKTYYYKVRAYKKVSGKLSYSAYSSVKTAVTKLATPTLKKSAAALNSIALTWNKVSGATGYQIYRSTSKNGTYSAVKTLTANSFTNSSLPSSTTYYYKVRVYKKASGKTTYGAFSSVVGATTAKLATPSLQAPSVTSSSVTLNWGKVSGAAGYQIFRGDYKDGSYTKVGTVTGTTFTNKNLEDGETFYYKVRAYENAGGKTVYGAYSSVKAAKTSLAFTVENAVLYEGNGITITTTGAVEKDSYGYNIKLLTVNNSAKDLTIRPNTYALNGVTVLSNAVVPGYKVSANKKAISSFEIDFEDLQKLKDHTGEKEVRCIDAIFDVDDEDYSGFLTNVFEIQTNHYNGSHTKKTGDTIYDQDGIRVDYLGRSGDDFTFALTNTTGTYFDFNFDDININDFTVNETDYDLYNERILNNCQTLCTIKVDSDFKKETGITDVETVEWKLEIEPNGDYMNSYTVGPIAYEVK